MRHREVDLNIMTSHTLTTSVLLWADDNSWFKVKYIYPIFPAGI